MTESQTQLPRDATLSKGEPVASIPLQGMEAEARQSDVTATGPRAESHKETSEIQSQEVLGQRKVATVSAAVQDSDAKGVPRFGAMMQSATGDLLTHRG